MITLGIESSCDETAVAIVENGKIRSNIIVSQVKKHAVFGGVVPEVASRMHIESILPVTQMALDQANVTLDDVELIAVTKGPGLVGALLIGVCAAKAIAFSTGLPIVGVNHVEGHLTAILLERDVPFPYIGLIVSGGHTSLYLVRSVGDYTLLGKTIDDAAGEALDKVAKVLGLGYPGGAIIDAISKDADCNAVDFPRGLINKDNYNFSFSGMKTAASQYIKKQSADSLKEKTADIAASFQEAVVDALIKKGLKAAREHNVGAVVLSGGVACNSRLRHKMTIEAKPFGIDVMYPKPVLCADNAAMIAALGESYLARGETADWSMNALARWEL